MARNRRGKNDAYNSIYSPFNVNNTLGRRGDVGRMYRRILTELAVNRFKWVGLPPGIDERFMELTLHYHGMALFYWDNDFSRYFAVRGSGAGKPNMYDNPTEFIAYGNSTFPTKRLKGSDCVPIWANYLRLPDTDIVSVYTTKLMEVDRTTEINIIQQRRPYLVTVPEEKRLTMVNTLKAVTDGDLAIYANDNMNVDGEDIKVFPLGVDKDIVLNTILAKQKIWNECMTLLGINNANQDKKERLVSDEVDANNGQIVASRMVNMKSRQEAAEQINARYNLSISVEWNQDPGMVPDIPSAGPDRPVADTEDDGVE